MLLLPYLENQYIVLYNANRSYRRWHLMNTLGRNSIMGRVLIYGYIHVQHSSFLSLDCVVCILNYTVTLA